MRLRVINGFYDAEKRRIIEKNEIIEASDKEAAKLLARKLVRAEGEIDAEGNFSVNGEVIGHVEGDNIVITDEATIKETLADIEEAPKKKRAKGKE